MATEYVEIAERVRIRRLADEQYAYAVEVVTNHSDHWHCVGTRSSEHLAQVFADTIRIIIRPACEAVRERCAEVADASGNLPHGADCRECAESRAIAATIRELEL